MKYSKLLAKIFAQKSNNSAQVAVAVIAGLAAGAVISILLAPNKGADTRDMISDQAKNLGTGIKDRYAALKNRIIGNHELEEAIIAEVPHYIHSTPKRRKSAIKDILHDAHVAEAEAASENNS